MCVYVCARACREWETFTILFPQTLGLDYRTGLEVTPGSARSVMKQVNFFTGISPWQLIAAVLEMGEGDGCVVSFPSLKSLFVEHFGGWMTEDEAH